MDKHKLVIFASGSGSNAENLAKYFRNHEQIEVHEIMSNRKGAFVHERARKLGIPSRSFSKEVFNDPFFVEKLQKCDYIILAGFLWLIPKHLIEAFPDKIINIHPALLPKYGGRGMFGDHVHRAVIEAGDGESGITIHLVNEEYDKGQVLFQAKCTIGKEDNPETLAQKVHQLEYQHFPKVVEEYILRQS